MRGLTEPPVRMPNTCGTSRAILRTRQVEVLESELHVHGVPFLEDRVRYLLENQRLEAMFPGRREMIFGIIRMLNRDDDGAVSHFILHARKTFHAGR